MDDRQQRADGELEMLEAHFRSLDPDAPTAEERLVSALGPELARKLMFALAQRVSGVRRAA
jgi:hypothetical protein